jgi:hypothetical protein
MANTSACAPANGGAGLADITKAGVEAFAALRSMAERLRRPSDLTPENARALGDALRQAVGGLRLLGQLARELRRRANRRKRAAFDDFIDATQRMTAYAEALAQDLESQGSN